MSARILGIDPGLQVTGYAVLEAGPAHRRGRHHPERRARTWRRAFNRYIRASSRSSSNFSPTVVAVEQLYAHYEHPRTAILMGHARGVILLAAAQHNLAVVSYNATRIKKTITGSGRAGKEQVQRTIQRELGLATLPEPPDVADALAAALCHHYLQRASGLV